MYICLRRIKASNIKFLILEKYFFVTELSLLQIKIKKDFLTMQWLIKIASIVKTKTFVISILVMLFVLFDETSKPLYQSLIKIGWNADYIEIFKQSIKVLFLLIFGVFIVSLSIPAESYFKKLADVTEVKLKEELEKAQEYSKELLYRMIKSLPLEELLYKVSGADSKYITTEEDRIRYKTTGAIMLMVFIYTFIAILYIMTIGEGSFLTEIIKDEGSILPLNEIAILILEDNAPLIALLFAAFIVGIDRIIISDHSIEYRLFKVRLQRFLDNTSAQKNKYEHLKSFKVRLPQGNTIHSSNNQQNNGRLKNRESSYTPLEYDNKVINHLGKIFRWLSCNISRELSFLKWCVWGIWTRSNPVSLLSTPRNSREWQEDAAALFHPRSLISIIFTFVIRLGFALGTSIIVSTSILMMFYKSDIDANIQKIIPLYQKEILNCNNINEKSLGCDLVALDNQINLLKSEKDLYSKLAAAETQKGVQTFCIKESLDGVHRKYEVKSDSDCTGPIHTILKSTGATSSANPRNNIRQKQMQDDSNKKDSELSIKEKAKDKLNYDIQEIVENYKKSLSVRLAALKMQTTGGVSSDKFTDFEFSENLQVAFRGILICFEMIPVFLLKVQPFFGWTPSTYIFNLSEDRLKKEKMVIGLIKDEKHVIPLSEMETSKIIVEIIANLRLPIFWIVSVAISVIFLIQPLIKEVVK